MRKRFRSRKLLLGASASVLLVAGLGVTMIGRASADSGPVNLRVNHAVEPLGIESAPRFSWQSSVVEQTAYRIQVGRVDGGRLGGHVVWDTGRVESAEDLDVPYDGPVPASRDRFWWRVQVWDEQDRVSRWSDRSTWETGLLEPGDWSARWIGGRAGRDHDWTDMTWTSTFRVTGAEDGISFLFHAQPWGKTWGEGYVWRLHARDGEVVLTKSSQVYAGHPFNPQNETNPTTPGTTATPLGEVEGPDLGGITADTLTTADHQITIDVRGATITTTINGQEVDSTTVADPALVRPSGTVGFLEGAGIIRDVTVESPDRPAFTTDFAQHANPFENGIPSAADGLTLAGHPVLPIAKPAPLLRTEFDVADDQVASARLYVAGGGWPRVTLNGEPVTEDLFVSGHTSMDTTVLYSTYDVTDLLEGGGANALAAELGRGWYGLATPNEWFWHMANFHGEPRLLAQLEVTYADGTQDVVVTGPETWTTADGPTTYDSAYTGETYDARLAPDGYDRPGFDSGEWTPAVEVNPPGSCPVGGCEGFVPDQPPLPEGFVPARLRAQEAEPVRVVDTVEPVEITSPSPGVHVFDYGQNLTGHARLSLAGTTADDAGKTVVLRHDEILGPEGQVEESGRMKDGRHQEDAYTLAGTGDETWEPSFGNKGFRYVEVRGLEEVLGRAPTLAEDAAVVTARHVRTTYAEIGEVTTDNALLNQIQSNVRWTNWNNTILKPTDTPNREKNGWTGDTTAAGEAYMLNNDMVRSFEKWARDLRDAMISTGEVPEIVPAPRGWYGYEGTPGWTAVEGPTPSWDAAYFVIPWELYQQTGNTRVLEEMYPTQQRFMAYYAQWFAAETGYQRPPGGLQLGEYGATGGFGTTVIDQQWNYYFADYMATVGELLGDASAASYRTRADELLRWFVDQHWDPATHSYRTALGNLETMNVMAIEMDMVPGSDLDPADPRHLAGEPTQAENRATVAATVADDIEAQGAHLGAGVFGIHYLFNVLDEYGYTDLAYRVATQTESPSWGWQIGQGATTLWEQWGEAGSHNHPYFNSISTWLYQGLGGITPAEPGYRKVVIKPFVPAVEGTSNLPPFTAETPAAPATLDAVDASIATVRGMVASSWVRTDEGTIRLTVTIPGNTPAEVWVPTMGREVTAPDGIDLVREDTAGGQPYAVYEVPPGTFTFN